MSAIELEAFLAAMDLVRRANLAATAAAPDAVDASAQRDDAGFPDLPTSPTLH